MMMIHQFLRKLGIIIILSLFFLPAVKPLLNADEEVTLEVWAMGAEGKKIVQLTEEFERLNPGVHVLVQAIPWGAAHEKLITAVAGESTPDVCQLGSTWVSEFVAMGVIQPLNTYLERSDLIREEDFFAGSWETNRAGDMIYGIPWYVDTRVLFYRTDLLEQVGFSKPPETWGELKEAARLLAKDLDGDGINDRFGINLPIRDWGSLAMFIWQNGGEILAEDLQTSALESVEAQEAIEFYVSLFSEGLSPREMSAGTDIYDAFSKGFIPMFISGPWMLKELDEHVPDLKEHWNVSVLPGKKNRTSFIGGSSLVLFKSSKKKELAWKFIEFMSDPKVQVLWYKLTEDLPSNQIAWRNPLFDENPKMKVFGYQLLDAKSSPPIPTWEQIADIINDQMEKAIFQKTSVKQTTAVLSEKINQILQKEKIQQSPFLKLILVLIYICIIIFVAYLYFRTPPRLKKPLYGATITGWDRFCRYIKPVMFVVPSLAVFITFLFAPIFISLLMSFTDWDMRSIVNLNNVSFIGVSNYTHLLVDPVFQKALLNTFIFVIIGGPLTISIALALAIFLNSKIIKFRTLFRVGYFAPVVTTMVAVAVVWRWLYNSRFGLINYGLELLGFDGINWLGDVKWALPALILMAAWKNFGYSMVIFLAGLQGIPHHYYEASNIDGANRFQAFWYITLPLLKPTLFFVTIITSIGYFQFFAEPYIMTDGGPLDSTISVVLLMYRHGFKYYHMGYASAIAYILFFFIALFSVVQFRLNKDNVDY
ncbi:MAG: extracellular solute-binding protein [Chlamydiota bacterium]|nr:extracellular solute-binding protein [Chlamydiota bacterium]